MFSIKSTPLAQAVGATLVMFLWAICFPLITVGLAFAPPMTFAFLRALAAGFALVLIATLLGRPKIQGSKNWICVILIGLTATSVGFYGMFNGGKLVSPGIATVVSNTQPLFAAFLATLFLHEKLSRIQICGILFGFVGILFISLPELYLSDSSLTGIGYILFSALAIAVSNIFLKKVSQNLDVFTAMGWQLLIGAIPLGALAVAIEQPFSVEQTSSFYLSLLLLSIFGTALPFALWFKLLSKFELTKLNVYTFLTPVFGVAIGVFLYNEVLGYWQIAGVVVITLGIILVTRSTVNA